MVTSVLYDQFRALNKDFHIAVSGSGEFQGSVREFRRRHQTLSQSVQNADQFMMISNVAGFCCQVINLILIIYCSLFFPEESVSRSSFLTFMHIYWTISMLFCLTLTACQGVVINHMVRRPTAWNTSITVWALKFISLQCWLLTVYKASRL